MLISLERIEIFKKFKISQVGTDVGYLCAKSLRADLRNEEMRELRVKRLRTIYDLEMCLRSLYL